MIFFEDIGSEALEISDEGDDLFVFVFAGDALHADAIGDFFGLGLGVLDGGFFLFESVGNPKQAHGPDLFGEDREVGGFVRKPRIGGHDGVFDKDFALGSARVHHVFVVPIVGTSASFAVEVRSDASRTPLKGVIVDEFPGFAVALACERGVDKANANRQKKTEDTTFV